MDSEQKDHKIWRTAKIDTNCVAWVLTEQLRELEHYKIVHRKVYNEVPPRVEYSLTETGRSFIPVMVNIMEWGVGYIKEISNCDMNICIASKFNCSRCYEMLLSGEFNPNS